MVRLEICKHHKQHKTSHYLHSSMVRLEIYFLLVLVSIFFDLHSSMVRLEIFDNWRYTTSTILFTFQYG